jgi:hypothetical protein
MAARSSRATASASEYPAGKQPAPWDWLADWNRQQLALANQGAYTVCRGFEEIRRIQEETARATAERHAAVAEKLRRPGEPLDLALIQGELLRDDFSIAAKYWQDLTGVALEMNGELLDRATRLVDTEDLFAATTPRFLHG